MASENQANPNRVADAAELFARFVNGEAYLLNFDVNGDDMHEIEAANNAAVIAAQLLAVASATERIAIALEALIASTVNGKAVAL